MTFAGTSDIMFRGFSQTKEDPGVWGSLDLGYGICLRWRSYFGQTDYAGVGAGELDFYLAPSRSGTGHISTSASSTTFIRALLRLRTPAATLTTLSSRPVAALRQSRT